MKRTVWWGGGVEEDDDGNRRIMPAYRVDPARDEPMPWWVPLMCAGFVAVVLVVVYAFAYLIVWLVP